MMQRLESELELGVWGGKPDTSCLPSARNAGACGIDKAKYMEALENNDLEQELAWYNNSQ